MESFSRASAADTKSLKGKGDIDSASSEATMKGEPTPRQPSSVALSSASSSSSLLSSLSTAAPTPASSSVPSSSALNTSVPNPITSVVTPAAGANLAAPRPPPLVTASSPRAFHTSGFSSQSTLPSSSSSSSSSSTSTTATGAGAGAGIGIGQASDEKRPATTTTTTTTHISSAGPSAIPTSSSSSSSSSPRNRVFPTHIESGHPVSLHMDTSGSTLPVWLETCAPSSRATYPPLAGDAVCDVVIIGAGIAGLQVAYELTCRQSSLQVMIIDDGAIASGETGRTTAHLSNAFDDHYFELKKLFSEDKVRQVAESHTWAIDRVEEICQREGIDCDFVRINAHLMHGLQPAEKDYSDDELLQEYRAAQSVGLPVHLCEQSSAVPNFTSGTTVIFERQGQFHPLKYTTQLASKLAQRGVRIHCGTHASKVQGGQHSHVKTSDGHTIRAAHIVEATNIPISNKLAVIDKCMPERTYAIALYIPRGVDGEYALVYDMAEPYHYVRRCPATDQLDLLIVGGEDHKVGEDTDASSMEARFDRLEQWTRRRWPHAMHRAYCWSGQVIEPTDFVGLIGRNDVDHNNVYVVTGDSGNGMTHGVIAGRLLTDLITGSHNVWADLYNPRRMSHSMSTMVKHNLHVGYEYLRWVQGSDVRDIEDLQPCQGAVMSCRLPVPSHVAVYKDTQGKLHKMSAVCPHAYGIVHWNPLEHSWDCPAHGSRFTPFGKVVNGPSCNDLKPLQ